MTPTTIPSPQFGMKPWQLNGISGLAIGVPPLSGDLLSPLPQQRFTFATALQEECVLHLVVGLCRRSSNSSPFSTTAPVMMSTTTTTMERQSTSTYQAVEDEQE